MSRQGVVLDPPSRHGDDDIARLRGDLEAPELPYVDFSARKGYQDALLRWPLLAEFAKDRLP